MVALIKHNDYSRLEVAALCVKMYDVLFDYILFSEKAVTF